MRIITNFKLQIITNLDKFVFLDLGHEPQKWD